MQTLTSIFNPRELAILTLVLAGVIVVLFFKQPRSILKDFLKLAFSLLKMRLYLVMLLYMAMCVYIFYRLDLWEPALLKDTIKWLLFAATVTFFHIKKFQEDKLEYIKVFKEVFTGSVLLEFFTDKFTLSYWAELLLLPSITFIVLMRTLTEKEKKFQSVDKVFQRLLMVVGLLFLGHLVLHGIEDFHSWFNEESLKEFLLPVMLSVLLMPYIFALSVYMTYETQFISLSYKLRAPALLPYAKRKAFRSFFWDFRGMERWVRRIKFEDIKSKMELDDSIRTYRQTLENEKLSLFVGPAEGWSPYEAQYFLEPDFRTGFYDPRFEDKWMADSNHVYIGDSFHSNYFRYEVIGLELVAHSLELHLNIMTPAENGAALAMLGSYALELFIKSTGSAMQEKYLNKTFEGKPFRFNHGATRIRLERNEWGNTLNKSYDLIFTIQRGDTKDYD
jgi:hypothetical protein